MEDFIMTSAFRFFRTALCLALAVFLFSLPAQAAGQRLVLGANAVNTTQYVMAAAFSQVVGKHTDLTLEALAQGNVVTLPMLGSGDCDLIIAAADELDAAYFGKGVYQRISGGKGFEVRLLMLGSPLAAGFLVAGDSGITTAEELRGKRVVMDFGTSYALNAGARAVLYASGLTEKDVKIVKANLIPEAARMVIEGKADACFGSLGVPVFREVAVARGGVRHLGVSADQAGWDKAHEEIFAGYFPMQVEPSEANYSIHEPITLLGKYFSLVARTDLDDETAYQITKALWEYDNELDVFHPDLRTWKRDVFAGLSAPVPYHPGAIRFYKEVGVWTDELQAHSDQLIEQRAAMGK